MSNSTQIQITPENAEEFLESALAEEKAQKGEETPETPEEPKEPEEAPKAADAEKPAKEQDLEIGEKKAEPEASAEGETFSMEDVFAEWAEKGELSEETNTALVDRLQKAGFENAQGIIDQYISGAQATVATIRNAAFSAAGGEEQYGAMIEWARESLTPAQIAAYDASVSDPDMVEIAVAGLRARYEAAGNSAKPQSRRVEAGAKPDGDVDASVRIPRSQVQVSEMVSDKRYARDPGHRAAVDAAIQKAIERNLI